MLLLFVCFLSSALLLASSNKFFKLASLRTIMQHVVGIFKHVARLPHDRVTQRCKLRITAV